MTDRAQKVMDAFYDTFANERQDFIIQKLNNDAVAATLRELVNQCSTSLPPDSNMDEFYARMYGSSESVVHVDVILEICDELEAWGV